MRASPIDLDLGVQSKDAAGLLATLVKARGLAPQDVTIRFGFGPLGGIAMRGQSPMPWTDIAPMLAGLVADLAAQGFAGPFAVADGRVDSCGRRLGGAGARLRARLRRRLSPRARSKAASRSTTRAASSISVSPPTRTSS